MKPYELTIVLGKDGRIGLIDTDASPLADTQKHLPVRLDNGQTVWVPVDLLEQRPDGTLFMPVRREQLEMLRSDLSNREPGQVFVIPLVQEELDISTRIEETGVRVTKKVIHETQTVDEPGIIERIHIERVPQNRVLEEPLEPRQEGDTLIIPVFEEQVVVQKRLVLTEEIHVTKRRAETRRPQQVVLRKEEAFIEKLDKQAFIEKLDKQAFIEKLDEQAFIEPFDEENRTRRKDTM